MNEQDKAAWLQACNEWHANSGGKDLGEFMFQRGIEYAIEREPQVWRNTALRIGEYLCSAVPDGYYDMTPHEWLQWALNFVYESRKQEPVGHFVFNQENGYWSQLDKQAWPNGSPISKELYTTPPAPVGLTDEEIAEAVGDELDSVYLQDFRKVLNALEKKRGGSN